MSDFLKKHKICLNVFNIFKDACYDYKPITYNTHRTSNALYILVYNQQCWKLNVDLLAFGYKHMDNCNARQIRASKYYRIRRFDKEIKTEVVLTV